ncbi:MAG: glycosyltransferase family 4 protein [Candidatus Binatia bacterium]|nr:glycosyltransferase family 4 protein [Candidatus Binatia bacterium]
MLSPIAWRTPPRNYGPWEQVVSVLTEELVRQGADVTLFATGDSLTSARLQAVAPHGYGEDAKMNAKVWECLHISEAFEHAAEFDVIHNNFDFLPLTYSRLINTPVLTTIHGISSPDILPVYRKYNQRVYYAAISQADRRPDLDYIATVHHGIDLAQFTFQDQPDDYLLFFARIDNDKGAAEAINIARSAKRRLIMAGRVYDDKYFDSKIAPHVDNNQVKYVGNVGPTERNRLLGGAAALLHPINFNEPFGLSVVEAMACGTPVIAMNHGSMPEIIISGQTGFLVTNVAEAIEAVSHLPSIDRARCRQHVEEKFTAARMAQNYLRVYQQVVDKHAGAKHS